MTISASSGATSSSTVVSEPLGGKVAPATEAMSKTDSASSAPASSSSAVTSFYEDLFGAPDLDGPNLSVALLAQQNPADLIGKAMIQGVRYSQELSLGQAQRIENYGSIGRLQADNILDVIKDRREQIEEALKKQDAKKGFGIAMLVVGIVGTALTLGTATPLTAGLVVTGAALTTLTAVNDLMDNKIFEAIITGLSDKDLSKEEVLEESQKLGLALNIIGGVLMLGAASAGSGLASKSFNFLKGLTKNGADDAAGLALKNADDLALAGTKSANSADDILQITMKTADDAASGVAKSVDDVAAGAAKQADQADDIVNITAKSVDDAAAKASDDVASSAAKQTDELTQATTDYATKGPKTLFERLGISDVSAIYRNTQIAEVVAVTVESLISALNIVNDMKIAGHNNRVQHSRADEKSMNAEIKRWQSTANLLTDQQQQNQSHLVTKRVEVMAALIDSVKDSQLAFYTKR